MNFSLRRILVPLCLALLFIVTSCGKSEDSSRWEKAQRESTQPKKETAPAETKPAETKPAEPAETRSTTTQSPEVIQPAEQKPTTTQPSVAVQPAEQKSAIANKPVAGGSFNKLFPSASGEYEVVPSQEKSGFAEYKLKKGGKDVAMLAISDTADNPDAAGKFQQSTQKIAGFPAMEVGTTSTAILVRDRFQVKVLSRDPSFTKSDREAWLQKFDLVGLSELK
jgi:hypothetical protein